MIKHIFLVCLFFFLNQVPSLAIEKTTQVCDVFIDGPLEVCAGATNTYLITNLPPNAVVNFVAVGCCGAIGNFNYDNGITITLQIFETNPTIQLCVDYTVGFINCTTCVDIAVVDEPEVDFTLTGPTSVCRGTEAVYIIQPMPSPNADFEFSVTNGTIVSQNGDEITVIWGGSGTAGQLCFDYDSPCFDDQSFCLDVEIIQPPDDAILSGLPDFACIGDPFIASVTPTNYPSIVWTVSNSTLTSPNNGPEVEGLFSQTGQAEICVNLSVGCNNDAILCKTVTVSPPPNPTIAFTELCGMEGYFTAFDTRPGSTFLWETVSGPGNVFFGDPTLFAVGFIADEPGDYTFRFTETLGNCVVTKSINISLFRPLEVSEPTFICGPTGYRVTFDVNVGKPPVRVNGNEILNPAYTSEVIPYGSPFSFRVEDSGLCREDLNGVENCPCRNSAGTMRSFVLTACDSSSVTAVFDTNTVLLPGNLTRFVLHTSKSDTLGIILGISTTPSFTFLPSMQFDTTYYISRVVADSIGPNINLNDPCRQVSKGQPVVFYRIPDVSIPVSTTTCGNQLTLEAASDQPLATWFWQNPPEATDTVTFSDITASLTRLSSEKPGNYMVWVEADYNGCRGKDSTEVSFFKPPSIAISDILCLDSLLTYTANVFVSGGTAPFTLDQLVFMDTIFSVSDIPANVSYNLQIKDTKGCISNLLQGAAFCDCFTNAGTMLQDTLRVCSAGGVAEILSTDDSKKDINDRVSYILHNKNDETVGFIYATDQNGKFIYNPGIPLNQVLYISRIVGNNNNDATDLADPCLSVAAGQPVIFYPVPKPLTAPELSVCGTKLTADINVPDNQNFSLNPSNPARLQITISNNTIAAFRSTGPGTEIVEWTTTNPGCTFAGSWTVTFYPFPAYGEPTYECSPAKDSVLVRFLIDDTSGLLINNKKIFTAFNRNLATTDLPLELVIQTDAGCLDTLVLNYDCRCFSVAGTMANDTLDVCGTSGTVTAVYNNDGLLSGDSTFYILHTSPGNTVGDILAFSANPTFSFPQGAKTDNVYYISLVHYNPLFPSYANDPCAIITPGQPVIFYALPTLDTDIQAETCTPEATISVMTNGLSSEWSVSHAPAGGSFTSGNTILTGSLPGTYRLLITSKNEHCENLTSFDVTLFNGPEFLSSATTCFDTTFITTLSWQGGVGPYQLNNVVVAGNTFISDRIPSGSIWEAVITDTRGCSVGPLSFMKECSCLTRAGNFTQESFVLCEGENIVIPYLENTSLLPGQVIQYEVYTINNNQEMVVETLSDNIFIYKKSLLDTTIYIRAVAGILGTDGLIRRDDPCFALGEPLTLQWNRKPDWFLPDEITTCETDTIIIPVKNQGIEPFRMYFSINNNSDSVDISNQQYDWVLNLSDRSLPQTIQISGAKNAVCRTDSTFDILIQSASLWQASVAEEFFFQDTLPIMLSLQTDLAADSVSGIRWTFTDSGKEFITSNGELFIESYLTGQVLIEITDVNGCSIRLQTYVRIEEIEEDFTFPNILLNGSGENGIFSVHPKDKIALVTGFAVYDRWGNKQFNLTNMLTDGFVWQGQCIGGLCPDGVYVFYLSITDTSGKSRVFSGDITVMNR